MSYKSLLFCPDERTARLVTQVLQELEFSVEPVQDAYSAVKKLNDERFDALVVDCQNEQDGALLFKTARTSSQNHSSLSVAVVEGQAGVAKAFRIGANLVLTKPINIEQSKSTLRVARGLLRKSEAKPATSSIQASANRREVFSSEPVPAATPTAPYPVPANPSSGPAALSGEAPFSALEVEPEPTPEPEAAEVAVLESLPQLDDEIPDNAHALRTEPQPIAASSSGQAAAVAPALDKNKVQPLAPKPTVMLPLVTNEPIIPDTHFEEPAPRVEPPAFSSFGSARQSGGGMKFFKIATVLIAVASLGYFGWQKLQPLKYLQEMRAARAANTPAPAVLAPAAETTSQDNPPSPLPKVEEPKPATPETKIAVSPARNIPDDDADSIEVQELPMSRDSKPPAPSKPEPLVVKPDAGVKKIARAAQPAPPQVQVSSPSASASAIAELPSTMPALPSLAPPTSLRLSQGVSQGLLLKKVSPVYPPMALQLHKEGTVELLATISKKGAITAVKVLSGDPMLAPSAADAVRQWKYRPYLLNGEPVEIQTQITIKFKAPH